ncbi:zinc finger CCCH domain-containing protein 10-like isoform X2 [Apostichopus japonicus]|uniref:zinc finger CCCH domain-containing protein 10-like isoform X2 n=1 Tax=Stichopus japonicus TaxID=307972 RepID=UPI003AB2EC6D
MSDQENSEEICRDYLRKACTRGSSCKFRHPRGTDKMYQFCRDYQNSFCHRVNCKFIHCSAEAEDYYKETGHLPRSLEREASPESWSAKSDRQIPLCKDFLSGQCKRGMKCKYRHRSIGDIEYEDRRRSSNSSYQPETRIKSSRDSPRESSPFDEYSHDIARRRITSELPFYSRQSRLDEYASGGSIYYEIPRTPRSIRDYEEENLRLHRKLEDLRKQVDDLTATNEVLLEQNARLRTIKSDVSAVLLAESHLVRSTSAITPAQLLM